MPLMRSPTREAAPESGEFDGENSQLEAAPQASAISGQLRLPTFLKADPTLWFYQLEGIFSAHKIRSDDTKYGHLLGCLDGDALREVSDVVINPVSGEKYKNLKTALIRRYSDSMDRQLHKLLTDLELGDRKPSQLLRQMRSLAANRLTDDILLVRWRTLLPTYLQRMLKLMKNVSLDDLADLADELLDSYASPSVAAVSDHSRPQRSSSPFRPSSHSTHNTTSTYVQPYNEGIQAITSVLQGLKVSIDELTHQSRTTSRAVQQLINQNSRGSHPRELRNRSASPANTICRYHRKFGNQAQRCIKPCSSTYPLAATTQQSEN